MRRLQRRRNKVPVALDLAHEDTDLERAIDLAVLHEISPRDPGLLAFCCSVHLALLHVLGQIELYVSQCDSLGLDPTRVLLYDLELHEALLQHTVLVDDHFERQPRVIIVTDFVIFDRALFCASAMIRRRGMREVPFHE